MLDTNCLLQCISRRSRYHEIWLSLLDGRNIMCVTNEILEEYAEVIERMTDHEFAELAIDDFHFNLIKEDPDDYKFVDCAVAGSAKFIVSEDRHYNILKTVDFPRVEVLGLDEMMETFAES